MELKDTANFAILLCNELNDEKSIKANILKISLKKQVHFNWGKIDEMTTAVLYNVDKSYIYNFGANKKIKFIWKNADDFYIVDFANNTKGDIINYLTFEKTDKVAIIGNIKYANLKPLKNVPEEYKGKPIKIPLVSSQQLDEQEPFTYEPFIIYMENNTSMDAHKQI